MGFRVSYLLYKGGLLFWSKVLAYVCSCPRILVSSCPRGRVCMLVRRFCSMFLLCDDDDDDDDDEAIGRSLVVLFVCDGHGLCFILLHLLLGI